MATKTGYEGVPVSEIRRRLIEEYGLSQEEVMSLKPKSAAVDRLLALDNAATDDDSAPLINFDTDLEIDNDDMDDINAELFGEGVPTMTEDEGKVSVAEDTMPESSSHPQPTKSKEIELKKESKNESPDLPKRTDPEWHDYVMGMFVEDELVEGNPTVDGLRRVAEKIIGEFSSTTEVVSHPSSQDKFSAATVIVTITLHNQFREYSGAASVSPLNTSSPYLNHPVSTAETKAEGRALRKALGLRKVLAAEELSDHEPEVESGQWDIDAKITREMKQAIHTLAKLKDINVLKFINMGKQEYGSLDEVSFGDARLMLEVLNDFAGDRREIPAKIKGYATE